MGNQLETLLVNIWKGEATVVNMLVLKVLSIFKNALRIFHLNWHLVKQVMFNLYQNTILDWKSQCANHLPLFIDIYDIRCALESSIFFNRIETVWTKKTRIEDINLRILFLAVTSCKTFGKLFSMFSQNYVHLWRKCLEQISFSFSFF